MAQYQTYSAKSGDTLGKIARRHETTVGELVALNALSDPDRVVPGQVLNIRRISDTSYTVVRGDTLWAVGQHYGVSVPQLARANAIEPPFLLRIGQVLTIPGASDGSPPRPSAPSPVRPANAGVPQPGAACRKSAQVARAGVLPRSAGKCYRYVKRALLGAGAVDHYLGGGSAIEAGPLLVQQGYVDILGIPAAGIKSPYDAREGAVLIYKATPFATDRNRVHGHIEIRTGDGFASDYFSPRARTGPPSNGLTINSPSGRSLIGVYVKPDKAAAPVAPAEPAGASPPQPVAADCYALENLRLHPSNGKYRGFIAEAAQRTGMAPQAVAAIIEAEAAKVPGTQQWDANSAAPTSSARGLTQFLRATWLAEAVRAGGLLNAEARAAGCIDAADAIADELRLLAMRFDPRVSILAGADLAIANLAVLKRLQILPSPLDPAGQAKIAYLAHHEGATSAASFLHGKMDYVKRPQFDANVPASRRDRLLAAAANDVGLAYRAYLADYIDKRIDVTKFMLDAQGVTVPRLSEYFA